MPAPVTGPRTLYDKIFDNHVVTTQSDGKTVIMYIDRHILHEVTSPQGFESLRKTGRKLRRPDCTLATVDHNVPTSSRNVSDADAFKAAPDSRLQVVTLAKNTKEFGVSYFGMKDRRQGIVHVIGPEQGFTLPGSTIVCGDSHTSTHGAFGALAFGIGSSEVEHVMATQTIYQRKSKNMKISVNGKLAEGVTSKDVILHVIGIIGTAGGNGCVIEYSGDTFEAMSMEARMSVCNMSIEAGARAGMVAPDEVTFNYLKPKPLAPKGEEWERAVEHWKSLRSDPGAHFDKVVEVDAADIEPTVSWGTSPQDVTTITGKVPDPADASDPDRKKAIERSLYYMALEAGTRMEDIPIDKVFIGSCTNSRIEDLRSAAAIAAGRKVAPNVYAMIVPGSGMVKAQAEREGLDKVFKEAGFDWREAGCSMCLGMNSDQLNPGERCASTSNRNFEGRQGPGGRTHLMSPGMAAAAAVTGKLADVRKLSLGRSAAAPPAEPITAPEQVQAAKVVPDTSAPPDPADLPAQSGGAPPAASSAGLPEFKVLKGIAAAMHRANVDTDLIVPARFLKLITRDGLGRYLFHSLRFDLENNEVPDFVLNKEPWRHSKILVCTGPNFGCGSSREHAPWSLLDFGIRCIIAPTFADIHENNLFQNGMLPISTLTEEQIANLAKDAEAELEIEVDLENLVVRRTNGDEYPFKVDAFRRECLLNGWDDVSLTLTKDAEIAAYEKQRSQAWPWLDGIGIGGRFLIDEIPANKLSW